MARSCSLGSGSLARLALVTDELSTCPHCGLRAHQVIATPRIVVEHDDESDVWIIGDDEDWFRPAGDSIVPTPHRQQDESAWMWEQYVSHAPWQVALCAACKHVSFRRHGMLIFPEAADTVAPPHPDMPERAASLYREAAAVLSGSRRAAAALARASLESLLKDVDETPEARRDLNTRIGELRAKINTGLWKVLTALRVVGNDALHGSDDDLIAVYLRTEDADLAETFFAAINELVEELITRPNKAEELYALIPEAKRAAAERVAGK